MPPARAYTLGPDQARRLGRLLQRDRRRTRQGDDARMPMLEHVGSGGGLIAVVVTTSTAAATWTATGVTSDATGRCRRVQTDGSFGAVETLHSLYPDAVVAPRLVYATIFQGGLYLVTGSCTAVPTPT